MEANVKADAAAEEPLPPLKADAERTQENLESSGPPAKDTSTSETNDNNIPVNIFLRFSLRESGIFEIIDFIETATK